MLVTVTERPGVALLLHVTRPLVVWLALVASGCALSLDGPKPNTPKNVLPSCDNSKGLVAVDGLFGAGFAIGSLSAFANEAPEAGVVVGLIGVAYIASAIRGNTTVEACRDAMNEFTRDGIPLDDEPNGNVAGRSMSGPAPTPVRPTPAPAPVVPPTPVLAPRPTTVPAPATIEPTPAAAPAADPDEWRDFWTEVP